MMIIFLKRILIRTLFFAAMIFASCEAEDPVKEEVPELITKVVLTFSNGDEVLSFAAVDPDAEGLQEIEPESAIHLHTNTAYDLKVTLINELALLGDDDYDISLEVEEEADEHRFYFGWTDGLFLNPGGDGNVDNGEHSVLYLDEDAEGLPLGLHTSWNTGDQKAGVFRLMLKHQPDGLKTTNADASVGETDVDVSFEILIE